MKHDGKSRTISSFPILVFIIIVVIALNGSFFSVSYRRINEVRQDIEIQKNQKEWEIVRAEILNQYTLSSADIRYLSKKIECAILRQYANKMDDLKEDFANKTFDEKLFTLFKQQLETDSSNPNSVTEDIKFNYILGFQESILAIFSDSNTGKLSSYKTWSEYFNASANVQLNESLVSNIINKNITENLLIYQKGNLDTEGSNITAHDIDALKVIYETQGLDGFKDIDFVNVAYITEYGDIFGTDDYLYLDKISNYKMILVGTSNIYETIYPTVSSKISQYEAETDVVLVKLSEDITRRCLEFVTVSLCLLVLIVVFAGFYNKDIQKQ